MPNLIVKQGYEPYTINTKFKTIKPFYFMYMPVPMSKYEDLKNIFKKGNREIDFTVGMIEKSVMFGFGGWIGLAAQDGDKEINQDFVAYRITGDYSQIKSAYQKVMKDYPQAKQLYSLYLTDPSTTKMDENVTLILIEL
jgi:hypothetical protein